MEIVYRAAEAADMPGMLRVLETANMHHVPSEEVPELDWRCCFVALDGDTIVGMSGYKVLDATHGKTTLMAVDPAYRKYGIGMRLQTARLRTMARLGVRTVTTNSDRPPTIEWYKKHFGYEQVGTLPKVHEFGDPTIPAWTTLQMDLGAWVDADPRQLELDPFA